MDYEAHFQAALDGLKERGNYRVFAELQRRKGDYPRATRHHADGTTQEVTVWCSNDYLGMGQHPDVIDAMHDELEQCGAGAGGTRNISGTMHVHRQLELELADLHNKEDALLFTSGYVSNWAALGTLAAKLPNCVVLSDALNHASMIEGIRHSRAECLKFKHNDVEDLDRLLAGIEPGRPKLVAFESVYSMDGDIAPIKEIIDVCEKHGAMTYIDEVHAVGMYGAARRRRCRTRRPDGPDDGHRRHAGQGLRRDGRLYRRQSPRCAISSAASPRGFIFTTALPPAIAAGALRQRPPPQGLSPSSASASRSASPRCAGRCAPWASRSWKTPATSSR